MRVKLDSTGGGVGGVSRVYEGLYQHLPAYGIEFVEDVQQADVVHAHIAMYEELSPGIPLVVSSHGMLWDIHGWGKIGWKVNHACIEAYRQADIVTAPSKFVAQALARNMLLSPLVVHHGINADEWLPGTPEGYVLWNKARADNGSNPEDMNVLAERVPTIKFLSTFGEPALNVTLTGLLPPDEMKELVRSAAVYLDTPKESGGPCFGVLEAMACQVPVLAWNEGGNAEIVIHKQTGYLAEPGNFDDLIAGLVYCLQERSRLGQNARQLVSEQYTWQQVVGGYVEAYQQAVQKHQYGPKVSVVVPCYNLASFLPACVESVQKQTFTDWELIIVNDDSPDNTQEVAEQLAVADSRIKVVTQPYNRHVSAARNTGIQHAKGEYILPLDADDRLPEQALARLVGVLDSDRHLDIAAGKLVLFNEGDYENGRLGEWPNNADYDLQIQGYNRLPYSSLYRRKVWERVGGYRERIRDGVEDADFWTRALSFGHRATILEQPTLLYTMRSNGLGKQNARGTDAWLPWFGWAHDERLTPFAAAGNGPYPVHAFDKPVVSVVIPVGPGHAGYVLGCLDSLLAQTDNRWEAVIINDTGQPLAVPPYVTLVNNRQTLGVAASRNAGIAAAKADRIIFLDVDDYAQPRMVELFVRGQEIAGGWVYADWLDYEGTKQARDWDITQFRTKMLGPITGLFEREHLLEVGGFDTEAPGWEDWELQLKLVERGICGTRIAYPAIYYNMHAGQRREENFSRAQELVQYISNKYGDKKMGCSKCGGKATLNVKTATTPADEGMVLIEYIGTMSGAFTRRSPTRQGAHYRVTRGRPFQVTAEDARRLMLEKDAYRIVEVKKPAELAASGLPALTGPVIQPAPVERTLDTIGLRPDTLVFIKRQYSTLEDVAKASDAELLSVKGIGPSRVAEIRKCLN